MPVLPPIPAQIMLEYNFRHNKRASTAQDSKIPQRYKRRSSIFQNMQINRTSEDPYSNILHDLGKLHRNYQKSVDRKRYQDSDSSQDSGSGEDFFRDKEENPILQSHIEMVKKLKSKKGERELPSKAPERYLPNSMFARKPTFVIDFPVYFFINQRATRSKVKNV
jgi:hypothetical protein